MAFLTESLLMDKAQDFEIYKYIYITESINQAQSTIFLSHSHKDKKLVEGLIELFAEQGIYIYVDWNDSNMPRITNKKTAKEIKKTINELKLFCFLATKNGLSSKWCPWELGVADSLKKRIFIIPVIDRNGQFKGNEYLQIYERFELISPEKYYILEPGFNININKKLLLESKINNHQGIPLKEYLNDKKIQ